MCMMTENDEALGKLRECIAQGYTLKLENLGMIVDDETKTVTLQPNPKYTQEQKNKERISRNEYENE